MLLVVPGFVTDAIGLLLLLPPIRSVASKALVRRYTGRAGFRVITATYGSADGAVIDTGTVEPSTADQPAGRAAPLVSSPSRPGTAGRLTRSSTRCAVAVRDAATVMLVRDGR